MSAETATLAAVLRVEQQLGRLERQLDAVVAARDPWPDRLTTSQAMVYARCSRRTLYRWLAEGRLSDLGSPRRWLRGELDRCAAGDRPALGAALRRHLSSPDEGIEPRRQCPLLPPPAAPGPSRLALSTPGADPARNTVARTECGAGSAAPEVPNVIAGAAPARPPAARSSMRRAALPPNRDEGEEGEREARVTCTSVASDTPIPPGVAPDEAGAPVRPRGRTSLVGGHLVGAEHGVTGGAVASSVRAGRRTRHPRCEPAAARAVRTPASATLASAQPLTGGRYVQAATAEDSHPTVRPLRRPHTGAGTVSGMPELSTVGARAPHGAAPGEES